MEENYSFKGLSEQMTPEEKRPPSKFLVCSTVRIK